MCINDNCAEDDTLSCLNLDAIRLFRASHNATTRAHMGLIVCCQTKRLQYTFCPKSRGITLKVFSSFARAFHLYMAIFHESQESRYIPIYLVLNHTVE